MKIGKLSSVSFLVVFFFVSVPGYAFAEDFYFFRIDTELNVPAFYGSSGATITYKCNGTGQGIVTDGTASESTNLLDGIIKIASTSAENASNRAGCNAGEAITATASFNGWVSRLVTGTVSGAGSSITFTTRASMDYTILVNGVTDELGTALTLNGTTASSTYSGTVASQSYSGGKRYIAGSTSGGTVTAGSDGYVNRTSSALTVSAAASQSVDFGTADNSTLNESGLLFGNKIQVWQTGGTFETSKLTSGTVLAGDSYGTTCTIGTSANEGYWYCPVPLANTGVLAQYTGVSTLQVTTGTYADRTAGSDSQTLTVINPISNVSGGDAPTPTPTPSPTLSPTPTPTPTPPGMVKLFRKVSDPKVYVQGMDGTLTWIRTLEEFNAAGYNWADVQVISGPEFAELKISPSSAASAILFRKADDPKVYVQGTDGTLTWVKTIEEFNAAGYSWADVQVISGSEFAKLGIKSSLGVKKGVNWLNIRKIASLDGAIIGKMMPTDVYEKTGQVGIWFKINFKGQDGWIHSAYTVDK